jgi:hypothetical protein
MKISAGETDRDLAATQFTNNIEFKYYETI